jgi:hypothetical protein
VGPAGIEPATHGLKGRQDPSNPVPPSAAPAGQQPSGGPARTGPYRPVMAAPLSIRLQDPDSPTPTGSASPPEESAGELVLDRHFAIVPEWVIDAPISDTAYRLYSVLLRYGQSSGVRMPGRATLARRLHKKSTDTVDRALRELVDLGAVVVEHRHSGKQRLSNRYHLITDPPGSPRPGPGRGGRTLAASAGASGATDRAVTGVDGADHDPGSRSGAATGHRTGAAGVAAPTRHDPGVPTQNPPPPTSPATTTSTGRSPIGDAEHQQRLLAACGIPDLDVLAAHCQQLRRTAGKPTARWTAPQLLQVLHRAVTVDGWPPSAAVPALLAVAADPATTSPMRLTAPGPWWDLANRPGLAALTDAERAELHQLDEQLEQLPDGGVGARYTARNQLTAEEQPRTRLSVARRAGQLLQQRAEIAS